MAMKCLKMVDFGLPKEEGRKWPTIFGKAPPSVADKVSKVTYNDEGVFQWLYTARDGGKLGCFWPMVVGVSRPDLEGRHVATAACP